MTATNNFLQWNPGLVNQESDVAWANNAQRLGGAANPSIFASVTANKLFYQVTTMIVAFAEMLKDKGYSVSDADISTLTSTLASVVTVADIYAIDSGAANAYNINAAAQIGVPLYFIAANQNTGASTLTTTNLSTIPITRNITSPLIGGEIFQNLIVCVVYDGTNFQLLSVGGMGMLRREIFLASGTWVVPVGVNAIWMSGCGAGGGGGSHYAGGNNNNGGGGGAGANRVPISVTPGETLTITIGAGGIGYQASLGQDATDGGDTIISGSFGTLSLPGGKHGANTVGGDGGLNPGSGGIDPNNGGDCYEISNRICGAGGGARGSVTGSKGGRSGWGPGYSNGVYGGGGSGIWGTCEPGYNAPANSGAGGGAGIDANTAAAGGSGRLIIEYFG